MKKIRCGCGRLIPNNGSCICDRCARKNDNNLFSVEKSYLVRRAREEMVGRALEPYRGGRFYPPSYHRRDDAPLTMTEYRGMYSDDSHRVSEDDAFIVVGGEVRRLIKKPRMNPVSELLDPETEIVVRRKRFMPRPCSPVSSSSSSSDSWEECETKRDKHGCVAFRRNRRGHHHHSRGSSTDRRKHRECLCDGSCSSDSSDLLCRHIHAHAEHPPLLGVKVPPLAKVDKMEDVADMKQEENPTVTRSVSVTRRRFVPRHRAHHCLDCCGRHGHKGDVIERVDYVESQYSSARGTSKGLPPDDGDTERRAREERQEKLLREEMESRRLHEEKLRELERELEEKRRTALDEAERRKVEEQRRLENELARMTRELDDAREKRDAEIARIQRELDAAERAAERRRREQEMESDKLQEALEKQRERERKAKEEEERWRRDREEFERELEQKRREAAALEEEARRQRDAQQAELDRVVQEVEEARKRRMEEEALAAAAEAKRVEEEAELERHRQQDEAERRMAEKRRQEEEDRWREEQERRRREEEEQWNAEQERQRLEEERRREAERQRDEEERRRREEEKREEDEKWLEDQRRRQEEEDLWREDKERRRREAEAEMEEERRKREAEAEMEEERRKREAEAEMEEERRKREAEAEMEEERRRQGEEEERLRIEEDAIRQQMEEEEDFAIGRNHSLSTFSPDESPRVSGRRGKGNIRHSGIIPGQLLSEDKSGKIRLIGDPYVEEVELRMRQRRMSERRQSQGESATSLTRSKGDSSRPPFPLGSRRRGSSGRAFRSGRESPGSLMDGIGIGGERIFTSPRATSGGSSVHSSEDIRSPEKGVK